MRSETGEEMMIGGKDRSEFPTPTLHWTRRPLADGRDVVGKKRRQDRETRTGRSSRDWAEKIKGTQDST
jgi:hypothetical protein